jgi:hypothetical protein
LTVGPGSDFHCCNVRPPQKRNARRN